MFKSELVLKAQFVDPIWHQVILMSVFTERAQHMQCKFTFSLFLNLMEIYIYEI